MKANSTIFMGYFMRSRLPVWECSRVALFNCEGKNISREIRILSVRMPRCADQPCHTGSWWLTPACAELHDVVLFSSIARAGPCSFSTKCAFKCIQREKPGQFTVAFGRVGGAAHTLTLLSGKEVQ